VAGDVPRTADPERVLAELGESLCTQLVEAVPAWVIGQVERIIDAWDATAPVGGVDREAVSTDALDAGRRAQRLVADRLRALLSADLDAQATTPLEIVRSAVVFPTAVLVRAGVPHVVRDAFDENRFPDDVYGLSPASLGAVDEALTDPARAWGAAKAMAHKARHGSAHP
jgi:hypothetical protein